MPSKRWIWTAVAVTFAVTVPSAAAKTRTSAPSVTVPRHPNIAHGIVIDFHPHESLPSGGYYYAVLVLAKRYATRLSPKQCGVESNMSDTEYTYPNGTKPVRLTLVPVRSTSGATSRWCAGTTYRGAVYAVPHPAECTEYGGSFNPGSGTCRTKPLKGKVARYIRKPGELPRPRAPSAHVVAYLRVTFGKR